MRHGILATLWLSLCGGLLAGPDEEPTGAPEASSGPSIAGPREPSRLEELAVRELRRLLYLRVGRLVPLVRVDAEVPGDWRGILVCRKDRPFLRAAAPAVAEASASLRGPEHLLLTVEMNGGKSVLVVGGGDVGVLYGAYRLAEHLGVRFYLHGEVVPDREMELVLPDVDEACSPLFSLRGIQPFHDFPEGPDWWSLDDYKAILGMLPKLRMNFFGLHTYPEGHPNAEPTVWIGLPEDIGEGAAVRASYPSSYQNTLRGNWGYEAKETGDFSFGTSMLFDRDDYGAEVMEGLSPRPESPRASNELFERTGKLLRDAFWYARGLGVRTCVGTEIPLTVPERVQARLRAAGRDPSDPAVVRELYRGVFLRAARTYPIDYYWLWTPEGWTWQGATSDIVQAAIRDLGLAVEAWKAVEAPFQLATCGWVLGPQGDRALFHAVLPKGMPVSCIHRAVGNDPVDPAFERVTDRPKWTIPWLEDDPGLTLPQLWVGRLRRDAADARRYGCTGLMGIHWRTRILGPNALALARAAWSQDAWNRDPATPVPTDRREGPEGGQVASFPGASIADTDDDALYRTVRYGMKAYRFRLPRGRFDVTLKLCEPHHGESGKRVFGVRLEGREVIDGLDLFETVGKCRALDFRFDGVEVSDGWLDIEFLPGVEFPSVAAIAVEGREVTQKVNCGGEAYLDYASDWPVEPPPKGYLPTADFYEDWVVTQFGSEAGEELAGLFGRLDGSLPRPADWVDGPGGMRPDSRPWDEVAPEYSFVDELAALRGRIVGRGNRERFDYWLSSFRYLRAMGKVRCVWARMESVLKAIDAESEARRKRELARDQGLPVRRELVAATEEVYARLLETISNPGELGAVANWEQHILPGMLERPGAALAAVLEAELPEDARPYREYGGEGRVIVPTVRTSVNEGEALALKVIILTKAPHRKASVFWRPLGEGEYRRVPVQPVARGVYSAALPPARAGWAGLEYHVEVLRSGAAPLRFPSTAPERAQTVVIAPAAERPF